MTSVDGRRSQAQRGVRLRPPPRQPAGTHEHIDDIGVRFMARLAGKSTRFGAFLDSTLDRVGEGLALFAACYLFAGEGQPTNAALCAFAILASVMVSYTRARAEALNADAAVGFGSRATRVVILSAGLILAGIFGYDDPVNALSVSVWVLAFISTITAIQRILHVRRALLAPASGTDAPADDL